MVKNQLDEVSEFVKGLSLDDVTKGDWFASLLTFSLGRYKSQVDAEFFASKYPGLPADALAQRRIDLAARYAAVEGALSAGAYTAAVAATIGSGGGASPLTLPAGGASFVVDMVYTTQLQLQLAYDLAVIYRVPLDPNDPEDLWKLIRIAFGIRAGEAAGAAALKGVPAVIRPAVKKFYSKGVLAAGRSLPVVGKYLLQRNVIKFAIPAVGVPLSTGINYWTTRTSGEQARQTFRQEASIVEIAERMCDQAGDYEELVPVIHLVARSDGKLSGPETLLLHQVAHILKDSPLHSSTLAETKAAINVDHARLWEAIESSAPPRPRLYEAAVAVAALDGRVSDEEFAVLRRLASSCGAEFDKSAVKAVAKSMRG